MTTTTTETLGQKMRRLTRITEHVEKLDDAERDWLMARLAEVECRHTRVGKVWRMTQGRR